MNRYLRGRLLFSAALFLGYAIAAAALAYVPLSPVLHGFFHTSEPLALALGLVNLIVVGLLNPWRADRVPDRFPHIFQDAIVIALFGVSATLILQEKILATTAVGAVVIGFALQETLGNLFAGLAIQIEKPFRVGHWVTIGGKDGIVSEITWRATKIRTKAGNFVIVPNSALARDTITNYSEPTPETRIELEVGVAYDAAPNDVKAVMLDAIRGEPLIAESRPPEVLLAGFADSSITYRLRVWTTEFGADDVLRDRLRTAVYYAFRRHDITIPFPVRVNLTGQTARPFDAERAAAETLFRHVPIFADLSASQRAELATVSRLAPYGRGETVVRQGEAGASMFVLARGEAVVRLEPSGTEVARFVEPGAFFGEMSLLTGEPRTASVVAVTDCDLFEIAVEPFRRVVLGDPTLVERVGVAVAARRAELQRHAAHAAETSAPESQGSFIARIRRFLRIN